ncbi:MAG: hypothetical protein LBI44_08045 [Oscillospiraceae bacterium]|jgi:Leucine-rich repeat (LRR) protein|nr:hypothetical protein [Oscillospiraceae bacterium]
MKKRTTALVSAFFLLFTLAACSGASPSPSPSRDRQSPSPSGDTLPTDTDHPSNPFDWRGDEPTPSEPDPLPDDAVLNFPDPAFEAAVRNAIDKPEEDITKGNVAGVTVLDVSGTYGVRGDIKDLTGIEHFTALTNLSCRYNQLTMLDVTLLTALTSLNCRYNYFPNKSAIIGLNESRTTLSFDPQNSR